MKFVSEEERSAMREQVRREFPDDEMMQDIHFVRRLHRAQTEGLSRSEQVEFYQAAVKKQSA